MVLRVVLLTSRLMVTTQGCPSCAALLSHGKSDKTTQRRELGTNQSDYCEKLHGERQGRMKKEMESLRQRQ